MRDSRIDEFGMCLDEYEANISNKEVYHKRAIGEYEEMECSKALASIMDDYVSEGESILDVGCAVGHYYKSLKNKFKKEFYYTGVDPYSILIDEAKVVWKDEEKVSFFIGNIFNLPFDNNSFDYVICNNVMLHLPEIVKPIGELIRVARKRIIIRHLLYDKSYRIQLVYNSKWWPYTEVKPEEEFDSDGNPLAFSYFNIHSFDYFSSVIRKYLPDARINFIKDDNFSHDNINKSADIERFLEPTRVVKGNQVTGCLILPNYFVEILK